MPPMIVFKAGKVDSSWREAAPSGYAIRCSKTGYINVTAEISSLTRLTNDAFRLIQDTSFRLKCLRLRCHDFSALAD